jgi:hypothetical protein
LPVGKASRFTAKPESFWAFVTDIFKTCNCVINAHIRVLDGSFAASLKLVTQSCGIIIVRLLPYMNAVTFLEKQIPKLLSAEILISSLVVIPSSGAKIEDIDAEELKIGLSLSGSYRSFLQRWNGLNLDVIRFFGVGNVVHGIPRLSEKQQIFDSAGNFIFIVNDPAGFALAENREGHIYSFDHDGGEIEMVCKNFDTFVIDYLFGKDSNKFMGEEWQGQVVALD